MTERPPPASRPRRPGSGSGGPMAPPPPPPARPPRQPTPPPRGTAPRPHSMPYPPRPPRSGPTYGPQPPHAPRPTYGPRPPGVAISPPRGAHHGRTRGRRGTPNRGRGGRYRHRRLGRSRRPPRRRPALRLGRRDRRLTIALAVVAVLLLVIGGRLVQLQAVDHADYAGAAAAQRVKVVPVHALRGSILDRDGTPLAFTSGAQDITADPTQVPPTERLNTAIALAPLLSKPVLTVMADLAKPGQYSLLGTALDSQAASQIEDLDLRVSTPSRRPSGSTRAGRPRPT